MIKSVCIDYGAIVVERGYLGGSSRRRSFQIRFVHIFTRFSVLAVLINGGFFLGTYTDAKSFLTLVKQYFPQAVASVGWTTR